MKMRRLCGLAALCAATAVSAGLAGTAAAGSALAGAENLCVAQGGAFDGQPSVGLYACSGPDGTFTSAEVKVAATFCVKAVRGSTLEVSSFGDFYACIRF
jgi:hypothetical protein